MRFTRPLLLLPALLACAATTAGAQSLDLAFQNGQVRLSARDVPLRTVLSEWSRIGGTRIINGERVPGGLVTLELTNVPERAAIDVLLRHASGYLIGPPRRIASTGASTVESILILPTSTPVAASRPAPARGRAPAGASPLPPVQTPFLVPPSPEADDPDENPIADVPAPEEPDAATNTAGRRIRPRFTMGGVVVQEPPGPPAPEDREPEPRPVLTNPFGVVPGSARPGVITPVPPQRETAPPPDPER